MHFYKIIVLSDVIFVGIEEHIIERNCFNYYNKLCRYIELYLRSGLVFMDNTLINSFRECVNEHDLVFNLYHVCDDKNKWNIICSAMDWITVSIDGIDPDSLIFKNNNQASIRYMSFIMCIDILWESVQQLHRVIFNTREIPFKSERSIFKRNNTPKNDNDYFKMIRACFAAHPVNLNDHFTDSEKKEQRYASWSGGGFGHGDFSVILYSNKIGEDDIFLDIYTQELLQFAEQRYEYLKVLIDELNKQKEGYLNSCRSRKIQKSHSIIEQISILVRESKKRLNSDYYNYELQKLNIIFSTQISCPQNIAVVNRYREALTQRVNEIFWALQNMTFGEFESEKIINDSAPKSCQYAFSKLCDVVYGNGHPALISTSLLKSTLGSIVNLDETKSYDELYVVVLSGFFTLNNCQL